MHSIIAHPVKMKQKLVRTNIFKYLLLFSKLLHRIAPSDFLRGQTVHQAVGQRDGLGRFVGFLLTPDFFINGLLIIIC